MGFTKYVLNGIIGALVLATMAPPCSAEGPWQFLRQLPEKNAGVNLERPVSIAIDTDSKRYYVVDPAQSQLVSFDQEGNYLAAITAGGQLDKPLSMGRTDNGSLWVVNRGTNELLYINPRQQKVEHFRLNDHDGAPVFIESVAVDRKNRVFVLDGIKGAILQLDDHLKIKRSFSGGEGFSGFEDFLLENEEIWALESLSRKIYHFSMDGQCLEVIQLKGLEFPVALERDRAGQIYVLDRQSGTVVVFGRNGEKSYDFLGKGKRNGQIWNGSDLLFDWAGRLCVVDEGSGRVEILTR